jgi:hypothetical protein
MIVVCRKCGDIRKPCYCSLVAEVKTLRDELARKCDLCEASTDARAWQAENEALRQAAESLLEKVAAIDWAVLTLYGAPALRGMKEAATQLRQLIEGSK